MIMIVVMDDDDSHNENRKSTRAGFLKFVLMPSVEYSYTCIIITMTYNGDTPNPRYRTVNAEFPFLFQQGEILGFVG